MERRVRSLALFWLICVTVSPCFGQLSFPLPVSPSSVAVSSDSGEVFVAAGAQLLRLDGQLRLLENVTVSGELLRIALSPGGGRLVGCLGGSSRTCLVFNSSSLWSGAIATVSEAQYLTENGMAVIAVDHSFYLGSEGEVGVSDRIRLSQYQYTADALRTREYNVDVGGDFDRLFYGGFARNGYVYFFVADVQEENGIRVLRVCDCESGSCSSSSFEALYELTLQCRGGTSSTTEVCGVTLLETFADRDEPVVVVTQCEVSTGSRNRVCGYLLSEIDSRMDTSYEECRDNTVSQIDLPWESVARQCSSFTPLGPCDFGGDSPAVIPDSDLSGYYLVNLGGTIITAGVAVRVEGVSLVYVAYSGNITVFNVNITEAGFFTPEVLDDAIATHPVSSPVRDLQWSEGAEYIIVTTNETVFQLALEMCSQYSSCSECAGENRYPLCGWCTVENKCSRRSQCQSSSEERRWVVSSEECISSTVSPEQFVLERPTIVNVSASPSLPSGLTYNCSFSGSGDVFPIEVEAVEVVAGTEYQCDIRGIITDLGTVLAVTSFSFVSVEVGIPFATSDNNLTIYDCGAASSCGGCVQTANACGWCLYGNVCSGTPDPCPVPAGVSNSYLQLGGRLSYVEVCPILDPAPTSSGDYTQPVRVERSLQLHTRNLPQPVDGFEYMCKLGGSTLPAPYNATDGSVMCTIVEEEVTTASTVSLELIWGNGTIQYSLDENSEDDIRCILYDCPLLASGCSSCIAVNAMSFQCGWCSADTSCAVVEECSNGDIATSTSQCPTPAITSVLPLRGPVEGGTGLIITGTDLGAAFSDIVEVTLQGPSNVTCSVAEYESDYIPGTQVVCETEAFSSAGDYVVVVTVNRSDGAELVSGQSFSVEEPTVSGVSPVCGPVSGGVEVVISGSALDTGNTEDTRVELNGVECVLREIMSDDIRCISGAFANSSDPSTARIGPVVVFIDNAIVNMSGVEFEYRDDPVYSSASPQMIIPAGGIEVIFDGVNLDVVDQPVFVFTDSRLTSSDQGGNCSVSNTTMTMTCVIPSFMSATQLPTNISYTIRVGDAPGPDLTNEALTLDVMPDPIFATDGSAIVGDSEHVIGSGALLEIKGSFLDSVEGSEISVTVGGEPCIRRRADDDDVNTYVCTPPDNPPGGNREAPVVVQVGTNLEFTVGTLTYTESESSSTPLYVIIIAASAAGGVLLFSLLVICCIICWYSRKSREKEKRFTTLLAQMELWEVEMADECKRAFTELQTDLADLVQISDDKNLPYRDFRSFAMRFLFPSAGEDHPVLNPLAVANREELMPHLQSFRELIMDRKFLLLFVRTLEAQQGRFSLQDKCNVASLLMVALQNDLDYATDILKTLLSEVMHHAVTKSHPKLLLRRTESVAEKMLANWLSFLLFPYLLEHAGEPLFILYRAIKSQLEKGPVDVITGEARHSLSEEKLLRQKFDAKPVDGLVETDSEESIPIKLLDCDTVTQAKEKILDVLHKNTAVSKRPQLHDVDLELRRATAGVALRDHDATNEKDGEWTKINTLGHYRLAEMSQAAIDNPKNPTPRFKIVPRPERPISGVSFDHFGTIIANLNSSANLPTHDMPRVYHLVKPDQADVEDGTGPRQGKILSEVFLTRLLSTKRILQPYVDDLFKAIFAVPRGKPLPKAIKCLFDFLDLQAAELGIQDPEILHTWKTNSLPLRFWVSLIKNPDFVFDIHKSATVDACLTIIAQAYIDACSTADMKYTKDTPSARLLYVNEVKAYKQDVQQYYGAVQSLPKLSDYDMAEYLRETAQVCAQSVDPSNELDSNDIVMTRQLYFVTESALYELFKFVATYSVELKDALNDEGLTLMANKLEQLQRSIKV